MAFTLGVLINPYAGIGGPVALKGSDGDEIVALAEQCGAQPKAQLQAIRALRRLEGADVKILTAGGAMGEWACREAGLTAHVVAEPAVRSSAQDTLDSCAALLAYPLDLLLFAGGDGTARDIASTLSGASAPPMLGIPAGVKMYSGVFARSPEHAGDLARRYLIGNTPSREAELLDIDEQASRDDRISTRLYGYARVPVDTLRMQSAKSLNSNPDRAAESAAMDFAALMQPDHVYFLGPGRTVQALATQLGSSSTLLGVDAYLGQRLICKDATSSDLLALAKRYPAHAVMGITGGQGCLFGRGNQPLSAEVLALIPREHLHVFASQDKLIALPHGRLFVDCGDPVIDARLSGYLRVQVAPGRSILMRILQ